MGPKWFWITITDHDYNYTTYRTPVAATSKIQAIALGAALIGQAKHNREYGGRSALDVPVHVNLLEPEVRVDDCPLEEYWEHRDTVVVVD